MLVEQFYAVLQAASPISGDRSDYRNNSVGAGLFLCSARVCLVLLMKK